MIKANDPRQALPRSAAMLVSDEKAGALENAGLWRRAGARWLEIMGQTADERVREAIALRRDYCARMASGHSPDTRLKEQKRQQKARKRTADGY